MSLLVAIVALACTTAAFLFTIRMFNRPDLGRRLKREAVVMPVSVGFTSAFALCFAFVVSGAMAFALPVWADAAIGTAIAAATMAVVAVAMRMALRVRPPVAPPLGTPTAV